MFRADEWEKKYKDMLEVTTSAAPQGSCFLHCLRFVVVLCWFPPLSIMTLVVSDGVRAMQNGRRTQKWKQSMHSPNWFEGRQAQKGKQALYLYRDVDWLVLFCFLFTGLKYTIIGRSLVPCVYRMQCWPLGNNEPSKDKRKHRRYYKVISFFFTLYCCVAVFF